MPSSRWILSARLNRLAHCLSFDSRRCFIIQRISCLSFASQPKTVRKQWSSRSRELSAIEFAINFHNVSMCSFVLRLVWLSDGLKQWDTRRRGIYCLCLPCANLLGCEAPCRCSLDTECAFSVCWVMSRFILSTRCARVFFVICQRFIMMMKRSENELTRPTRTLCSSVSRKREIIVHPAAARSRIVGRSF